MVIACKDGHSTVEDSLIDVSSSRSGFQLPGKGLFKLAAYLFAEIEVP
jgi:hypothetical protein